MKSLLYKTIKHENFVMKISRSTVSMLQPSLVFLKLQAWRCESHLLYRPIGVIWILCVNVPFLYRYGVTNVLFRFIAPDKTDCVAVISRTDLFSFSFYCNSFTADYNQMWSQKCNGTNIAVDYTSWCLTLSCKSTCASLLSNSCTTSVWPLSLAQMRAVLPS